MSKKKNTIDRYFQKIIPQNTEENPKCCKKVKTCKETNMDTTCIKAFKLENEISKVENATELLGKSSQDSQLILAVLELSDTPTSKATTSETVNTPSLKTPHSESNQSHSHSQHSSQKQHTNLQKVTNKKVSTSQMNSPQSSGMSSIITTTSSKHHHTKHTSTQLRNSQSHCVLVDTAAFHKYGVVKAYPSHYNHHQHHHNHHRQIPFIFPYCYSRETIVPFCDGGDGGVGGDDNDGVDGGDDGGVEGGGVSGGRENKLVTNTFSSTDNKCNDNTREGPDNDDGNMSKQDDDGDDNDGNVSKQVDDDKSLNGGDNDAGDDNEVGDGNDDYDLLMGEGEGEVAGDNEVKSSTFRESADGGLTKHDQDDNLTTGVSLKHLINTSINKLLSTPNKSSLALAETIQSYQPIRRDFTTLHAAVNKLSAADQRTFLEHTLPSILTLVLNTTDVITQPIPILVRRVAGMVTMSQWQAACLLANAFMCTFVAPPPHSPTSRPPALNSLNFHALYGSPRDKGRRASQVAKLHCFFNYFRRLAMQMSSYGERGLISFERVCDVSRWGRRDWSTASQSLSRLVVTRDGCIEDATGLLQVDFANKYIGGGVLRTGAVQEEIRFCICPEAVVACLLAERLEANECLILRGCEQFSSYKGYASSFEFKDDYHDLTPRDSWRRIGTEIVAIDALHYSNTRQQYKEAMLLREVNKAYCGFAKSVYSSTSCSSSLPAVATGNWGCGAFKGDLQLKAIIQLVAASRAGRCVQYFVFGEEKFAWKLQEICRHLQQQHCTTGQLFEMLLNYWPQGNTKPPHDLFTHIINHSTFASN